MAKRGRPKAIGATKEKVISVRMESSAAAAIETISARFGVSSAYLIRQAINAISVTQAKSVSRTVAPVVDVSEKLVSSLPPAQPKREIFSEYLNSFEHPPLTNCPASAPPLPDTFAAMEERLRVEEDALRRAAEELERKRIEAEVARRQAEDEARLKADREAQARLEHGYIPTGDQPAYAEQHPKTI